MYVAGWRALRCIVRRQSYPTTYAYVTVTYATVTYATVSSSSSSTRPPLDRGVYVCPMTETRTPQPAAIVALAYGVRCPQCGQHPDEPCRSRATGRELPVHLQRVDRAVRLHLRRGRAVHPNE